MPTFYVENRSHLLLFQSISENGGGKIRPRKSGGWSTQKYGGRVSGRQDRWVFQDKERHGTLRKFAWTKIIRHRLVPSTYSPDDPTLQDYWSQRHRAQTTAGRTGQLARRQHGLCPGCHQALDNGEEL